MGENIKRDYFHFNWDILDIKYATKKNIWYLRSENKYHYHLYLNAWPLLTTHIISLYKNQSLCACSSYITILTKLHDLFDQIARTLAYICFRSRWKILDPLELPRPPHTPFFNHLTWIMFTQIKIMKIHEEFKNHCSNPE